MAAVNVVALLVLGICLVFAALPGEHHLNVRVEDQDVVTSESIDINYERKYVKISSSGSTGTQAGSMLHDYTQGMNVLKRHGECYILDKFKDIPEDIKDWEKVESDITDDIIRSENVHQSQLSYRALPYAVNSTTLPASVPEFCPGPIRVVILQDVKDEDEPRDQDETSRDVESDDVESRDSDDDEEDEDDEDDEPRGVVSDNEDEAELPTTIVIPTRRVAPRDQPKLRVKRGWRRRIRIRFRGRRLLRRIVRVVKPIIRAEATRIVVQGATTLLGR